MLSVYFIYCIHISVLGMERGGCIVLNSDVVVEIANIYFVKFKMCNRLMDIIFSFSFFFCLRKHINLRIVIGVLIWRCTYMYYYM